MRSVHKNVSSHQRFRALFVLSSCNQQLIAISLSRVHNRQDNTGKKRWGGLLPEAGPSDPYVSGTSSMGRIGQCL